MTPRSVQIGNLLIGQGHPFVFIGGPCVIETHAMVFEIAARLKAVTGQLDIPFIFKASFDKANRTSLGSFRGPGLEEGLNVLRRIKAELNIPLLSDVHRVSEIAAAAEILDVIQIPAFLSRQTDLLLAAGRTGRPINIKKGQFLAPWDVKNAVDKVISTGNPDVLITERGSMFGYNNLVVDFRGLKLMRDEGWPVIFDATHSIQLPGGAGSASGGQREFAPVLARAAVAAGVDGIFMEVHPNPDQALCDGPNSLKLDELAAVLRQLKVVSQALKACPP